VLLFDLSVTFPEGIVSIRAQQHLELLSDGYNLLKRPPFAIQPRADAIIIGPSALITAIISSDRGTPAQMRR
jgi:hypothetical protein